MFGTLLNRLQPDQNDKTWAEKSHLNLQIKQAEHKLI